MRLLLKTHILIAGICVLALPAFAARKDKPSGPEIAQKARTAVLDSENSTTRSEEHTSELQSLTNLVCRLLLEKKKKKKKNKMTELKKAYQERHRIGKES